MTVIPATQLPQYQYVPETKEDLEWAELPTVDLTQFGTSKEVDAKLAKTLLDAIRTKGFFYVTGYDIDQERIDRQFAIGKKFYDLPVEEKEKYVPDLENGEYNGYRPAGRREISPGIKDQVEVYNIPKFNGGFQHNHPQVVKGNLQEIETFARDLHSKVLDPLFDLVSIGLGLPQSYFRDLHKYEALSEDHLRYMKYSKYTPEERVKLLEGDGLYSYGHTDLGTFTLLFRQPVSALQIKDHQTGEWKWAKPLDRSFTVNSCDAFSFLTGNYIKSTVHRVHLPPDDQAQYDRLGLLYFARPQNDLALKTIDSPVLKEAGYTQNEFEREGHNVPTMGEFVKLKQKWQQSKATGYLAKKGEVIVPGFKGDYYT